MSDTVEGRSAKAELLHRLRDLLDLKLIDEIPKTDLSRPRRVVLGRYIGDLEGLTLSVHSVHPLGPMGGRHDQIAEGLPRTPISRPWLIPVETIGGSLFDTWLSTVQLRGIQSLKPEEAIDVIDMIGVRIAQVIDGEEELRGFSDEYGQRIVTIRTHNRFGYAGGGQETAVDIRWYDWVALVSRPRTL